MSQLRRLVAVAAMVACAVVFLVIETAGWGHP
jgi:hypothetical protein